MDKTDSQGRHHEISEHSVKNKMLRVSTEEVGHIKKISNYKNLGPLNHTGSSRQWVMASKFLGNFLGNIFSHFEMISYLLILP